MTATRPAGQTSWPHRGACPASRCRACGERRSWPGGAGSGHVRGRPAAGPRRGSAAPARTLRLPPPAWSQRRPGPDGHGRQVPGSARQHAAGTQPRRPDRRGPAPVRPSVRGRRQPPRRRPAPPAPGATRAGQGRTGGRWRRPARRARADGPAPNMRRRRLSAPAGGGSGRGCRSSAALPLRRTRLRGARSRGSRPRATAGQRRRSGRQPRAATAAGSRTAGPSSAGGTSPRCGAARSARGAARSRRPAVRAGALPGSSSSARGLPRASATIRSRTSESSGVRTAATSSVRASLSPRPSRRSSGSPA